MAAAIRVAGECRIEGAQNNALIFLHGRDGERRLTYPELWLAARQAAAGLRAAGVRQGDRIVLMVPLSESYVATVCGAILLGVVPCTIASPALARDGDEVSRLLGHTCSRLGPALIAVPDDVKRALPVQGAIPSRQIVTLPDLVGHVPLPADALPHIERHDPHHVQLTSGSTGRPKGVVLTHHNVISNIQAIAAAIELVPRTEPVLMWLPCYHDMGFVQLLLALYYRATLVLMPSSAFLRNPLSWLQHISAYRAVHSAAPTFAYSLCVQRFDERKLRGVDLSSWRRALVGAEPVSLSILEQFRRTLQPYGLAEQAIYPGYGMAETVLASTLPTNVTRSTNRLFGCVSCDRIDPDILRHEGRAAPAVGSRAAGALQVVGVGRSVQGLDISIRAPSGQVLPDRAVGEICIRGTSLMQSYIGDAVATAAAIREGWYYTGDHGYVVAGELYVLGRLKELVIVRGRNFDPHDVEAIVQEHRAVRADSSVVFGIYNAERGTDDVIVIVDSRVEGEEQGALRQEIQASLQRVFGFVAREIVVVRHGAIPRTTSRKKQRSLAA